MSDDLQMQRLAQKLVPYLSPWFLSLRDGIDNDVSYTPTYLGGTTAGATTYTTQVGFYNRISGVVFFNGRVVWTAATGTGNAQISLPFTAQNVADMRYSVTIYPTNVTFANGSITPLIAPNTAYFVMNSPATNAGGTLVAVEAAGDIIFSGWFLV